METKTEDKQWLSWSKHFDAAENEVFGLFHTRSMWRAMNRVLETSEVQQHAALTNYLQRTYVSTVCSAIRREADPDTRTSSLARSLTRLVEAPRTITRDRFVRIYTEKFGNDKSTMAEESFNSFAPHGGDVVEWCVLQTNLSRLTVAADSVKSYTNKVIAHRQRPDLETTPISLTFGDIDHAVNELGEVTKQVHVLRHPGEMLARVTPVLDLSFLNMFKSPWLAPGFTLPTEPQI